MKTKKKKKQEQTKIRKRERKAKICFRQKCVLPATTAHAHCEDWRLSFGLLAHQECETKRRMFHHLFFCMFSSLFTVRCCPSIPSRPPPPFVRIFRHDFLLFLLSPHMPPLCSLNPHRLTFFFTFSSCFFRTWATEEKGTQNYFLFSRLSIKRMHV